MRDYIDIDFHGVDDKLYEMRVFYEYYNETASYYEPASYHFGIERFENVYCNGEKLDDDFEFSKDVCEEIEYYTIKKLEI